MSNEQSAVSPKKWSVTSVFFALFGIAASILYLLNLTAGTIEIPDNLPLVGNVDEFVMSTVLLGCLRYLGLDLLFPFKRSR